MLLWQNINDLKHKLLRINLELESERSVAKEKIGKNEQTIKHLLHLLKIADYERDKARDQLQRLINKLYQCTEPDQIVTTTPIAYKFQTTLEESHNMSETTTLSQINGLSPQEYNSNNVGVYSSSQVFQHNSKHPVVQQQANMELSSIAIDNLVQGKQLPEKGKLQQAVFEAGPLLQTLLVAPSPRWRIPPPPLTYSLLRNPLDFRNGIGNFRSSNNYQTNKSCLGAVQSSSSTSSHLDENIPYGIPSASCLNNGKLIDIGGKSSDFVKCTKSQQGVEECNNVRAVKQTKEFLGLNKI